MKSDFNSVIDAFTLYRAYSENDIKVIKYLYGDEFDRLINEYIAHNCENMLLSLAENQGESRIKLIGAIELKKRLRK